MNHITLAISWLVLLLLAAGLAACAMETVETVIHAGMKLERNHQYMDGAPGFHAKCLEVAEL